MDDWSNLKHAEGYCKSCGRPLSMTGMCYYCSLTRTEQKQAQVKDLRNTLSIQILRGRLDALIETIQFERLRAEQLRDSSPKDSLAWAEHNNTVILLNKILAAQVID